ncbi:MAG: hypothetical protein NT027_08500 [Proteobacteria bacterium]|nr:hypothetical protein [Pseudomonadota bacterium]
MLLKIALIATSAFILNSCTTTGNARKEEKVEYDYVAGRSGEDQVIVKDDNASVHSDRDAVTEYTKTVDTINNQRQLVESDLVGLNRCRMKNAEEKGIQVSEGQLTVDCMETVVNKRDRAGEDLVQVDGKLVLRKTDDFKARFEEARNCLNQMVRVRDMARKSYNSEGCGK